MRRSLALLMLVGCTPAGGLQLHLAPLLRPSLAVGRCSCLSLAQAEDPATLQAALDADGLSPEDVSDLDDLPDDAEDADASESEDEDDLGPFGSSIGRWDGEGDADFLQEMDWHVSSSYTKEEKEALRKREEEYKEADEAAAAALVLTDGDEEVLPIPEGESYQEPTYEFINYEEEEVDLDTPPPTAQTPMPSSWQEYQFLQEQIALIAEGEDGELLSKKKREKAAELMVKLKDFYDEFNTIISYGWQVEYNSHMEEAGLLAKELLDAKARGAGGA